MAHEEDVKQKVDNDSTSEEILCNADDSATLAQLSYSVRVSSSQSAPQASFMVKRKKSHKGTKEKPLQIRKRKSLKSSLKKGFSDHVEHPERKNKKAVRGVCTKSCAMIQAEVLQSSLGCEFPSFVKHMVRSHVTVCFWLGIPMKFSRYLLPKLDTMLTLEDESGNQHTAKYIVSKSGLSAGWRSFSVAHKLVEGDVLLFHLVEPVKFKVYILRANGLTEMDGALRFLTLEAHTEPNDADAKKDDVKVGIVTSKGIKRKVPKSLPLDVVSHKKKKKTTPTRKVHTLRLSESGKDSEDITSEVPESTKVMGRTVNFTGLTKFEDFTIQVNGMAVDSELPEHIRVKYYSLCCSRHELLHAHLLNGISCKLIAGIISEIVNIADAIRACKITTSRDEFEIWERTLKSFEQLGMNVGFLLARLCRLVILAFETEGGVDSKRYIRARNARDRTDEEIRVLEAKLVQLRENQERFCADVELLKSKAENYEIKFHEEANASW